MAWIHRHTQTHTNTHTHTKAFPTTSYFINCLEQGQDIDVEGDGAIERRGKKQRKRIDLS